MKWGFAIWFAVAGGMAAGCAGDSEPGQSRFASALSRFLTPSGSIKQFDNQTGAAIVGAGMNGASQTGTINGNTTTWGSTFGGLRAALVEESARTRGRKADGTADCSAYASCVQGDPCLPSDASWTVDLGCYCGIAQQQGTSCQGSGTMVQTYSLSASGGCFEGSLEYAFDAASLQTGNGGFAAEGSYFFAMNGCGANQQQLELGNLTSGCMISVYDLTYDGQYQRAGLKWCAASDAQSAGQRLEVLAPLPGDAGQELVLVMGETYTKDDYGHLSFSSGTVEVRGADGSLVCSVNAVPGSYGEVSGSCSNPDTGEDVSFAGTGDLGGGTSAGSNSGSYGASPQPIDPRSF